MNRLRVTLPTLLMTILQSVVLGFSGLMCMSQAYSLEIPFWETLGLCTGASVLFALCLCPRRSWPFTLMAACLYVGLLIWQRQPLEQSLGYVLYRITDECSQCFADVPRIGLESGTALWLLWAMAVPLCWVPVWVYSREGSILLVLLIYAPVLILVLIIVDLAPVFWLILLTGGLLLMLLTQHVRERSAEEGSRLSWWLVLPTMILVFAVTVLWPPADYERADWSQSLQQLVDPESLEEPVNRPSLPSVPVWQEKLHSVDLTREGPKLMTGLSVLEYWSETELTHLRGASLAVYAENAWKALDSGGYPDGLQPPLLAPGEKGKSLEIRTRTVEDLLYAPYTLTRLPEVGTPLDDACVQNTGRVKTYTVTYDETALPPVTAEYDRFAQETYLQLPDQLLQPLQTIVKENGLEHAGPEAVAEFVRSSGVYDLKTPRIPKDRDFVLYFLQESHRGYCVHFASATVLLLRTVGIPARYVTGYAVSGKPGIRHVVTQDDAHAWVEYYVPTCGWVPLDPTPAASQREPILPTEPVHPAPADPVPPEPEQPPEPPAPPKSDTKESGKSAKPSGSRGSLLLWLLPLPGLLALIWLRRLLVCRHRMERCSKAGPNRRLLTYWRWLVQLSKLQSRTPEEPLLCLAEKARFSQHTVTEEEIGQLRDAVRAEIARLRGLPVWKRLWYKYGRTLY